MAGAILEAGGAELLQGLAYGPATWLRSQAIEMLKLLGQEVPDSEDAPPLHLKMPAVPLTPVVGGAGEAGASRRALNETAGDATLARAREARERADEENEAKLRASLAKQDSALAAKRRQLSSRSDARACTGSGAAAASTSGESTAVLDEPPAVPPEWRQGSRTSTKPSPPLGAWCLCDVTDENQNESRMAKR